MLNVKVLTYVCLMVFLGPCMSGKSETCGASEGKQSTRFGLENVRALTDGTTPYMRPVWSPDGSKISFTKWGNRDICVIDVDGSGEERLVAEGAIGWDYAWSPCGKKIAYLTRREWKEAQKTHIDYRIEVVDVETGATEVVGHPSRLISYPVWLRSGEIVYAVEEEQEWRVRFLDHNRDVKRVIEGIGSPTIRVSPRGDYIAYTVGWKLRIVSPNEPEKHVIRTDDARYLMISFSPDGTKFAAERMGDSRLVFDVMSGTGSDLDDSHAHLSKGCWSSDGQWIVYHRSYDDGYRILASDLYLATSDGSQRIKLTDTQDSIEMGPYFSPDGKSITFWTDEDGVIWRADLCEEVEE